MRLIELAIGSLSDESAKIESRGGWLGGIYFVSKLLKRDLEIQRDGIDAVAEFNALNTSQFIFKRRDGWRLTGEVPVCRLRRSPRATHVRNVLRASSFIVTMMPARSRLDREPSSKQTLSSPKRASSPVVADMLG